MLLRNGQNKFQSILFYYYITIYQLMRRIAKQLIPVLKYSSFAVVTVAGLGYCYLQYINSQIGPINWNKDQIVPAYKQKYACSEQKAVKMYEEDIFDFSKNRIINYFAYLSTCENFNKKIGEEAINQYEKEDILGKIDQAGPVASNKAVHQKIFQKAREIRTKNKENNQMRSYIIKKIQELQMVMKTTANPALKQEAKAKIDKIYKYLLQAGVFFKDPEFIKYSQSLPKIQKKYPNDYFYKTIII